MQLDISGIKLPQEFAVYKEPDGRDLAFLREISKINIFVGANNSGKSRFMRLLASQANYEVTVPKIDLESLQKRVKPILLEIIESLRRDHIFSVSSYSIDGLTDLFLKFPITVSFHNDNFNAYRDVLAGLMNVTPQGGYGASAGATFTSEAATKTRTLAKVAFDEIDRVPALSDIAIPNRVYVPILRGLRPLNDQQDDFYASRTKSDYFSQNPPEIFSGITFYNRLTGMLLGNRQARLEIASFQDFISKELFENRAVELIPNPSEKVVVVKIGGEKELPVYQLGDGIQSAIILSFVVYVSDGPTMFFVEEPEMHLHPGLQRKLLEYFDASKHIFFMTTHSNHFLDLTIDIGSASVFTFRKALLSSERSDDLPNIIVEAVDNGNTSSLELLGVRNSSVFMVNATVWVEGITDRRYLKRMLESYMNHLVEQAPTNFTLEEDVHYSFVEYGGSTITHWSFLDGEEDQIAVDRLCAKAIVIIDKDGDTKLERKAKLSAKLKDRLIVLPGREIENMLPYSVIRDVVSEYEGGRVDLPDFRFEEYRDRYLGAFIDEKILEGKGTRPGGYQERSGTIKDKVGFCKRAAMKIEFQDLPPETQEMTRRIYDFIVRQNSG